MLFLIGAYHLFRAIDAEKYAGLLEELRNARNDKIFELPPDQIAEHFYQLADSAVQKFDARNGTDFYFKMLHLLDDKFKI